MPEINIIAKGESLKGYDLEGIPQPRVGINDVIYKLLCEVCCFWDTPRWFMGFGGMVWTIEPQKASVERLIEQGKVLNARLWKNKGTLIDPVNNTVPNINLSGILAIACATLEGYDEIRLWGYDGGGGLWFPSTVTRPNDITRYNRKYEHLITPGVRVINMINPECVSKIKCFETWDINEHLKRE